MHNKIPCLLYADDLAIFSLTKAGLQNKLNILNKYCETWGLQINSEKTKVVVFSKTEPKIPIVFRCGQHIIETVEEYKYLGIILNKTGRFTNAQEHLSKQANKALHTLHRTFRKTEVNPDIISNLYDVLILPISTYGAEVWLPFQINQKQEFDACRFFDDCLSQKFPHEKLHTKFCKQLLGVHKKTMLLPVLGELGRFPTSLSVICRIINYWLHILELPETSHIRSIYQGVLQEPCCNHPWVSFLKGVLQVFGFNHIWKNQSTFNKSRLKFALLQKLKTEYIHYWKEKMNDSSKLLFYKTLVSDYKTADYLTAIRNRKYRNALTKLRISAHDLQIEAGRYKNIPREKRICTKCEVLEDEYHFLDECKRYEQLRNDLLHNINLVNTGITKPSDLLFMPCLSFHLAEFVFQSFACHIT